VAGKKAKKMRTVASILGGKPTKRRWYELDAHGVFKWCVGRERKPEAWQPHSFHMSEVLTIKTESSNLDVCRGSKYSFELQVSPSLGFEGIFLYTNDILCNVNWCIRYPLCFSTIFNMVKKKSLA